MAAKNFLKSCIRVTLAWLSEDVADPHLTVYAHRPVEMKG